MAQLTRVHFIVEARTDHGEHVHVTGGAWSLGGFEPSRSVQLYTSPETYPLWKTKKPVLISTNKPCGYKYLIRVLNYNDATMTYKNVWESKKGVLRALNPETEEITVQDVFGDLGVGNAGMMDEQHHGHGSESSGRDMGLGMKGSDLNLMGHSMGNLVELGEEKMMDKLSLHKAKTMDEEAIAKDLEFGGEKLKEKEGLEVVSLDPTKVATSKLDAREKSFASLKTEFTEASEISAHSWEGGRNFQNDNANKMLVLVSFHLPVRIYWHDDTKTWSVDWDADSIVGKTENSVSDDMETMWIGSICRLYNSKESFYELSYARQLEIKDVIEKSLPCKVVILSEEQYKMFYLYFCKQKLRNNFHNVLQFADYSDQILNTPKSWETCLEVMDLFKTELFDLVQQHVLSKNTNKEEIIVWAHDYHLVAFPKYIRSAWEENASVSLISLKVIFFFHIPFPTPEAFRTLSLRTEVLEGILGADLIGFHTFWHARYFMDSAKRYLGLQFSSKPGGILVIDNFRRSVIVSISHVGIEPQLLDAAAKEDRTKKVRKQMIRAYIVKTIYKNSNDRKKLDPGHNDNAMMSIKFQKTMLKVEHCTKKKVFAGIDEVQKLKGIVYKLVAFERFLEDYEVWRKNVVFIQHGIRRKANETGFTDNKDESSAEIKMVVERINKKYGPVVVYKEHFFDRNSLEINERVALYQSADVFVRTPVQEGLNLWPLEYIYLKNDENAGVVIISEFAASCAALSGAIRVNPFDIETIAKMYDYALKLPLYEKIKRRNQDVEYIRSFSSSAWSRYMISELNLNTLRQVSTESSRIRGLRLQNEDLTSYVNEDSNSKELNQNLIANKYKATSSKGLRLFFLDFGGTLVERESMNLFIKRDFLGVSQRGLNERQKGLLRQMCSDERNIVFIVSGNSSKVLHTIFNELLKENVKIGLIASSGLSIRWGNILKEERELLYLSRLRRRESEDQTSSDVMGPLENPTEEDPEEVLNIELEDNDDVSEKSRDDRSLEKEFTLDTAASTEMASEGENTGKWETVWATSKISWKDLMDGIEASKLLDDFSFRTGGSYWKQNSVSTRWDYRQSDPEWGNIQADELIQELKKRIAQKGGGFVKVEKKLNSVNILPAGISKGTAIESVLSLVQEGDKKVEFGVAIGDDVEDEQMFQTLENFDYKDPSTGKSIQGVEQNLFTIAVGKRQTDARYYLNDSEEVLSLLESLFMS